MSTKASLKHLNRKSSNSPKGKQNKILRFITGNKISICLVITGAVLTMIASLVFTPSLAQKDGKSPETPRVLPRAEERLNPYEKDNRTDESETKTPSETPSETPSDRPTIEVASNYSFATTTTGSLTDMSTGTTQLLAANIDDTASALTSIGFDFYFQGARFTEFSINANGVLRLGATAQTSTPYKPLAQAGISIITAYGADQRTHAGDGKIHYKVTGSSPNRVLIIEWLNNQSNFNTGGTADLTYQVRLNENTGVIEFVYGGMTMSTLGAADTNSRDPHIGFSSTNTANNVGSVTAAQSGTPAPTFNGASNDPVENLYTAGVITALNSATDGARRTFSFTPPTPNAPTALNFTGVTQLAMTLNWTDSANETLYGIYRSTDGTNFTFDGTAAQNATSYNATGLSPATTYFWRVFAISEGALSTALSGSQATNAAGNISSTVAGGLWSQTSTWVGGVVPGAGDNATIVTGATVTIDSSNCLNLTVQTGATLQYEATTARTLTVGQSATVNSGGVFQSATTGTQTGHVLSIGGNLTNNGTIDFSTNANTAGAGITFTDAADASMTLNAGSTTDFKQTAGLTLNKGTNNTPVLTFTPGGTITVLGANAVGFLTITNGTFKLDGTNTFSNPVFNLAAYPIPATGGFWMNNPNATVAGQNGSPTLTGLFRMSQGTFNIGTLSGNSMGFAAGANINVEGGSINATGRFGIAASGNAITYNQTGGTITVCTIGNTSTTLGSFDLGTGVGTTNISGGTIIIQLASTAASGPRDFRNQSGLAGTTTVTGGTVQLGNAASGTAKAFSIAGVFPNLVISNTSANHSATFLAPAVFNNVTRNITINTGTTLNIGNNVFLMNGTTLTNNGTLTANGASSNFVWFLTTAPQLYTGTGVVTAPVTNFAIQADMGLTIDPAVSNITVGAIRLFSGSLINSNKITLGNGGATTGVVQIGNTTTATNAGTFDTAFTFNLGTGGQTISYLRTTNTRTTGPEINPTRTVTSMTYDDNDSTHTLAISGGDLTMNSAATALTMTNGRIVTGANTLILSSGTATVTRTNGYVDGNFRKTYSAAASKSFEVGTANGFSPVTVNVTAGTFPATFTAKAVQGPQPNIGNPSFALQRYWTLTGTGVTADLTFNYLDPTDIPVTATEGNFNILKYDGTFTFPGGTVTPAANTATITGVTTFSDWTLAEGSAVNGSLQFSNATYTDSETNSDHTFNAVVNRVGGSFGSVSVNYQVTDGTATVVGNDYTVASATGTLNWGNGDATPRNVTITVKGDTTNEPDETVNFSLNTPTGGASLGTPNSAILTITNDDSVSTYHPPVDFDGDGKSDFVIVTESGPRPNLNEIAPLNYNQTQKRDDRWQKTQESLSLIRTGGKKPTNDRPTADGGSPIVNWRIFRSSTNTLDTSINLGTYDDYFVPFDYDGDGMCDAAIWNPVTHVFTVHQSTTNTNATYTLGDNGSDPSVIGDYDGDGRADPAVFNELTGTWRYLGGATHTTLVTISFGQTGDYPNPGDFNGDGKWDFSVQRRAMADPSMARFVVAYNDGTASTDTTPDLMITQGMFVFGLVPGDYDGDGKTDIAQVNLSGTNIVWRVLQSSTGNTNTVTQSFGVVATDYTVQGDYDGDQKIDYAIWRPSATSQFQVFRSSDSGTTTFNLGGVNDYPVAYYNSH